GTHRSRTAQPSESTDPKAFRGLRTSHPRTADCLGNRTTDNTPTLSPFWPMADPSGATRPARAVKCRSPLRLPAPFLEGLAWMAAGLLFLLPQLEELT